jgi:hypothetical protein
MTHRSVDGVSDVHGYLQAFFHLYDPIAQETNPITQEINPIQSPKKSRCLSSNPPHVFSSVHCFLSFLCSWSRTCLAISRQRQGCELRTRTMSESSSSLRVQNYLRTTSRSKTPNEPCNGILQSKPAFLLMRKSSDWFSDLYDLILSGQRESLLDLRRFWRIFLEGQHSVRSDVHN